MKFEHFIPALMTPPRAGLTLSVRRLTGFTAEMLVLSVGDGSAILELGRASSESKLSALVSGCTDYQFEFAHGNARLRPADGASGRAFVDAVAEWLGLELDDQSLDAKRSPEAEASWVRLGDGKDELGERWTAYKLFLSLGERRAQVFFRLSLCGTRAQFFEKWSEYRTELVEILERTVSSAPARRVRQRTPYSSSARFGSVGSFEFDVPAGFHLSPHDGNHFQLVDERDEMKIELSAMRIPALPPTFGVKERIGVLLRESKRPGVTVPITTFTRAKIEFAWFECSFDSLDVNDVEAPSKPARERYLLATNDWVQVLMTGCCWSHDLPQFARAWDELSASLWLAGRLVAEARPKGSA